jgi:hypothetical protein
MGWMKARLGFSNQVVMQKLIDHIAADVNEWQPPVKRITPQST